MKKLLTVSGKLDARVVDVYRAVSGATARHRLDFLVVGASARDLVLHYAYGSPIQRGTIDLDFAIQVGDWDAYQALRATLVAAGYQPTTQSQRLLSPDGMPVDIVPFGALADTDGNINWPPENNHQMSILGFAEAHTDADLVRIQDDPPLEIPVVSPVGLVLLKLIAWGDQLTGQRAKDALDFRYVLENYCKLPEERTGLWRDFDLIKLYDGDIELAAAHLLGASVRALASEASAAAIDRVLQRRSHELLADMSTRLVTRFRRTPNPLDAFMAGYFRR